MLLKCQVEYKYDSGSQVCLHRAYLCWCQNMQMELLVSSSAPVTTRSSLLHSNDLGGSADTASKRPLRSQSVELGPLGTFCVLHCPYVFIHSMRSTRARVENENKSHKSERASYAAAVLHCVRARRRNRRRYVVCLESFKAYLVFCRF